jgi:Undecaprenyl-phosphate glucose phosphotransferase
VVSIFLAIVQSTVALIVLYYFFAPMRISRGQLLMYLVLAEAILMFFRVVFRNHVYAMYWKGRLLHRIILVGNGSQIDRYIETAKRFPELGYRFEGWADCDDKAKARSFGIPRIEEAEIQEIIEKHKPEFVVIGYSHEQAAKLAKIMEASFNTVTPFIILPDLTYNLIGSTVEDFLGIPLIKVNQPEEKFFAGLLKRNMDIVLSVCGLMALSPVLLFIALLVKLTSRGPVFFRQERMTMDGDRFYMFKFRTMKVFTDGTNEKGWTVKDDPRITPIGAFLRKTSLDELPQLWNVVTGEMSLVGPRPERPMYVEEFRQKIPAYMLRHKMKAGITGWAQVNGWRGDTSIEKRIEFDLYYIRNWSIWFDIKILFLTFVKGFVNKNAY